MEAMLSSETSILARLTRHYFPEDDIVQYAVLALVH
jgi:hypothetical protein